MYEATEALGVSQVLHLFPHVVHLRLLVLNVLAFLLYLRVLLFDHAAEGHDLVLVLLDGFLMLLILLLHVHFCLSF